MAVAGFMLDSRHSGELLRLERVIERPGRFRLVLAEFGDRAYLEKVLDFLDEHHPRAVRWSVPAGLDPADLEAHLAGLARDHDPIHLLDLEAWWRSLDGDGLKALNYRRERLADQVHATLVVWLGGDAISAFARGAPDLWAWRSAVLDFLLPIVIGSGPVFEHHLLPYEVDAERVRGRIDEIGVYLDAREQTPGVAEAGLFLERADLETRLGLWGRALADATEAHAIYQRNGYDYEAAFAVGRRAGILQEQGELDEALRIRREDELPVYERLGDQRLHAVTMGRAASILQQQGELGEALRIRQDELPVYERLGDLESRAGAMGGIADILQAQGELGEALRIRREEQLPVYEQLGNSFLLAVTKERVADILKSQGRMDEALQILRTEVLPVYERLDIQLLRVGAMSRIANILQVRGELDESIRIRREEVIPVYRRLGETLLVLVEQAKLANSLLQQEGGRAAAHELLCQTLAEARRLGLPLVETIESILGREQLHCDSR
jgi:tetratricopeptide (TPR) repeat protein